MTSLATVSLASPAGAQSPTPQWYGYDTAPGEGFPPTAWYASHGANAVVVEGLGSLACTSFTATSIENYTNLWVDYDYQTITEITPQASCGTITQYKDLVFAIWAKAEDTADDPGRYWGGIMLDEEATYDFSPSTLESLNDGILTLMEKASGVSWYYEEDQPNGWYLSTYRAILGFSRQAPQAYTATMVGAINDMCGAYQVCTQMVTVDQNWPYPWNDYQWVTGQIFGVPWSNSTWGTGYWWNAFAATR